MEIRGLGIINIRAIFGTRLARPAGQGGPRRPPEEVAARLSRSTVSGSRSGDDMTILGRKIPQLAIPVAPGRNIATLIEVACKVHILRKKGYNAPDEIIRRLDRVLT